MAGKKTISTHKSITAGIAAAKRKKKRGEIIIVKGKNVVLMPSKGLTAKAKKVYKNI